MKKLMSKKMKKFFAVKVNLTILKKKAKIAKLKN